MLAFAVLDHSRSGSSNVRSFLRRAGRPCLRLSVLAHSILEQGKSDSFELTSSYVRVFDLADNAAVRRMPRELVPRIQLRGPKISRNLTTAWYAGRVDQRFKRCLNR